MDCFPDPSFFLLYEIPFPRSRRIGKFGGFGFINPNCKNFIFALRIEWIDS